MIMLVRRNGSAVLGKTQALPNPLNFLVNKPVLDLILAK